MPSKDKRKLAAIMFADVVGYSRMMASNEERTLELLKDFENICSPIISDNDGVIIKKVGDELFCEFSSAKQAVDSSLAIQKAIQPYNDSRPKDFKLQVRIGIHVGDIVLRDGDVFGDGVNVASRIQPFASPGGICISSAVKESISSHPIYNIISEGQQELKNIIEKHTLYRVATGFELTEDIKSSLSTKKFGKNFNKWFYWVLLIFIGLMLLLFITDPHIKIGERGAIGATHSKENKILIPPKYEQLTFIGDAKLIDITKDGKYIAFSSDNNIFVQDVSSGSTSKLLDNFHEYVGIFSPDGSELLITGKDSLDNSTGLLIPLISGNVRKINIPRWMSFTWSPDGKKIAYTNAAWKRIVTMDITSNAITDSTFTTEDFEFMWSVDWSPNGLFFAFTTVTDPNYTIWTISVDGKSENKILTEKSRIFHAIWSPSGDALYYLAEEGMTYSLKKIKMDPATGTPIGDSYHVLTGLILNNYRISNSGDFIYTDKRSNSNLWSVTTEQKKDSIHIVGKKKLTDGTFKIQDLDISPDGKEIAFIIIKGNSSNIYTMPINGGIPKQLTYLNSYCKNLAWSPDGNKIVFGEIEDGINQLKIVDLRHGTIKKLDGLHPSVTFNLSWHPYDKILYQMPENRNFYVLDHNSANKYELIKVDSVGWMFHPIYSPDLKKIAVAWNRTGKESKYMVKGLYLILTEDTQNDSNAINLTQGWDDIPIGWSQDSKYIYLSKEDSIFIIEHDTGEIISYYKVPFDNGMFYGAYISMTPDGKTFIFIVIENKKSEIWRVKNFDPEFN